VTDRPRYAHRVEVRSLGYRTDLMIRTLEGSQVEDRGDFLVIRSPRNPTYWWGNFLLLARPLPGQAARWVTTFAAEFPAARHVALGLDVTEISGVYIGEYVAAGLQLQRSGVLIAQDLTEPPHLNRSAAYRELSGDDDWRRVAELRAVVNAGEPGGDPDFIAARAAAERALTEAGHGSWFGAFIDGELVAQLGLISDGSGIARYQNVETHPDWRRRGLAGSLVWHAGRHGLDVIGAGTLVIVADPLGDAIKVYRSVGFADAETQVGFERQPD
jgi:GNAT superfamily N-acetyltransferase